MAHAQMKAGAAVVVCLLLSERMLALWHTALVCQQGRRPTAVLLLLPVCACVRVVVVKLQVCRLHAPSGAWVCCD